MKTAVAKAVPTLSLEDDFDIFIMKMPIVLNCTPLEWWCHPDQRRSYPRLSRMAIDILSVPAESAEPERSFSGARRTCSWDRLRITCENIERVECMGSWLREGLITPAYAGLLQRNIGGTERTDGLDIEDKDLLPFW